MDNKSETSFYNYVIGFICIISPLIVGMISARMTGDQMQSFGNLNQPPLSPPAWLFPVVWTILYLIMGIVLLIILKSDHRYSVLAAILFMVQLALNFIWSPVFFNQKQYVTALVILLAMLTITVFLAVIMWQISKTASFMLIPYILWMSFASYLNAAVGILN